MRPGPLPGMSSLHPKTDAFQSFTNPSRGILDFNTCMRLPNHIFPYTFWRYFKLENGRELWLLFKGLQIISFTELCVQKSAWASILPEVKTIAEIFWISYKYNYPENSHILQWTTDLWAENGMALSGLSRAEDHIVSESYSPPSSWNRKISSFFCIWLPTLSYVNLIQIKSAHPNCSSTCLYHCCSPHVAGKALVVWIASSSGASAFHFGSQDLGIL